MRLPQLRWSLRTSLIAGVTIASLTFLGSIGLICGFLVFGDDSSQALMPTPTVAAIHLAERQQPSTPTATPMPAPTPTPTLTPAPATSTPSPEASPIAEVTPVVEFEVTVISAVVPANVRKAPTTEADLAGVIPIGVKAKVVGKVIGQEAFPGTGNRIWYLVQAIPPDLPEDGFVHSGVVKR